MKEFFKIFGPVASVICVLWFSWWGYAERFSTDMEKQGQLGDLFGGVNAVFSGLALAGVVTAVVLQSKELQLQREEMKAQREQLTLQREELTLTREEFRRMAKANEEAATALTRQLQLQIQAARIQGLSTLATVSNDRAVAPTSSFQNLNDSVKQSRAIACETELRSAIKNLEKHVMEGIAADNNNSSLKPGDPGVTQA